VLQDNIVETDEEFDLTLTLSPSAPAGINIGRRNRAIGVIQDSTGNCYACCYDESYYQYTLDLSVRFTQVQYSGTEISRRVNVTLELVGGTFVNPDFVNVTVSAIARSATGQLAIISNCY